MDLKKVFFSVIETSFHREFKNKSASYSHLCLCLDQMLEVIIFGSEWSAKLSANDKLNSKMVYVHHAVKLVKLNM